MNKLRLIIRGTSSLVSGGVFAFIGTCGAIVGEAVAVGIVKPVANYVWLDAENGYCKDYPEHKNDPIIKRVWRVMK
jgi:hypothetical protein